MPTPDRDKLKEIRTFQSLIKYLRDELSWPIGSDPFDDITYGYTPEELGIDLKNAVKIDEIKRLRPITPNQPWGIFFIKFAPGPLPIVALRRILSRVTLKRRASANSSERAAWEMDDLLFISNYGEGDERHITFAHFSQDPNKNDLPTLKVLGWDNLDTPLHLDKVSDQLTRSLSWPDDTADIDTWRKTWRSAFLLRHREVILTANTLSIQLAQLASAIRDRITSALAFENECGPLTKLLKAFKGSLVHDLNNDDFADMYAQTIAYGLLSARIANPKGNTADELVLQMPATNRFLKELMETFLQVGGRKREGGPDIDFDELGVSEVVELLDDANMDAVIRDFGDKNPQHDPVIHFYEHFLAAYDKKKKIKRGVFYTPKPIAGHIVRSAHKLLQTRFGIEDGLASTITWGEMGARIGNLIIGKGTKTDDYFVTILDPAVGTATFLVEAIEVIFTHLQNTWKEKGGNFMPPLAPHTPQRKHPSFADYWNEYVAVALLPRLYGYELMMAPYAIAHMKVCLKLSEINIRLDQAECESTFKSRINIYLTNALEQHCDISHNPREDFLPALTHEAEAVNRIKREKQFTVILGNPPYSVSSSNKSDWIKQLSEDYKNELQEKNIQPLSDDYIKFIRLGQHYISKNNTGVLAYISSNSFTTGLIHWQMRRQLQSVFNEIYILDLHGNTHGREVSRDGTRDENVFGITEGVSINFFAKSNSQTRTMRHHDLRGNKDDKWTHLSTHSLPDIQWINFDCRPPRYLFTDKQPQLEDSYYEKWIELGELFQTNITGVKTHDDGNLVSFNPFPKNNQYYDYRPFDRRYINYDLKKVVRHRFSVMRHMLHENISLIIPRQAVTNGWNHAQVSKHLSDNRIQHSNRGIPIACPLYLYNENDDDANRRVPNLNPAIIEQFTNSLGIAFSSEEIPTPIDSLKVFTPIDILGYVYAVLYSPTYRQKYEDNLTTGFPRVPIPDGKLFRDMSALGKELIELHLGKSQKLSRHITKWKGSTPSTYVERVTYADNTVFIDKAQCQGFCGVPNDVWEMHVGGYQVCRRWLMDRKDLQLSSKDIEYYQDVVVALRETIKIMGDIDIVVNQRGGWPSAFQKAQS